MNFLKQINLIALTKLESTELLVLLINKRFNYNNIYTCI